MPTFKVLAAFTDSDSDCVEFCLIQKEHVQEIIERSKRAKEVLDLENFDKIDFSCSAVFVNNNDNCDLEAGVDYEISFEELESLKVKATDTTFYAHVWKNISYTTIVGYAESDGAEYFAYLELE